MAGRGRRELRDLVDAVRFRSLEEVALFLGYVRDPTGRSRWRRDGPVLSVPDMRHYWQRFAPGCLFDVPVEMG